MNESARGDDTDDSSATCQISVLCVDDEPDVLALTASLLERENQCISTTTVTNAADALDRLDSQPVDCVVSDYQMPGMDGLTFLDRIRSDYGDLPFVLFTGKGSEEIASQAISRGVTDYLQKNVGTDQYAVLANCIENAVRRHRAESRFRSFLHSAPYGLVITDVTGRIHQVNGHLERQFGYHRDELLDEPIERLLPERYHEDHIASREAYVEDPDRRPMGAECDLWGRRRDGTEFPVEVTLCPIDLHSGVEIVASIHDVTDSRERDERLELAETLFENTQDALFVIDVDEGEDEFQLQRVNPVYETHTGLSNEALSGRRLHDVFGDEVGEEILGHYRECVARREPIKYVERVSVPETGPYWETRIAPVIIDGSVERLVGATRNVTAQRERERRYDAIFNQTYQFTGLMDTDGILLEANETALEFGDLDRDDAIGRPIWETKWFRDGDVSTETLQDLVDRASSGEFVRTEFEVAGADGTTTIDYSIKPITDETGEVVLLLPEGRDITELKQRERELEQKREFLAQIQEVADIGGWEVDFRSETLRWTDELFRIHGTPPGYDPTIEDGIDFYHPADRPTIETAFERLRTAGEPYDLELRINRVDGETRWVRTRGEPWHDDGGDLIGVRGTFQDITDHKRRERELKRQNERLDEFVSVVSHDLRNPLTVAIGSLELGRRSGDPADFDRVQMAHDRMNTLIGDLLSLARKGQRVEETTELRLRSVLDSAWETVHTDGATLERSVDDFRLEADEPRLCQLLQNLLSNAVEHSSTCNRTRSADAGETADVTVRVGVLDTGSGFYVEDDGPGIPAEEREAVFDHGYSTSSRGTGFGLSIVRSIAEAHGWTVQVRDSATGGARFEVVVDPNESTEA